MDSRITAVITAWYLFLWTDYQPSSVWLSAIFKGSSRLPNSKFIIFKSAPSISFQVSLFKTNPSLQFHLESKVRRFEKSIDNWATWQSQPVLFQFSVLPTPLLSQLFDSLTILWSCLPLTTFHLYFLIHISNIYHFTLISYLQLFLLTASYTCVNIIILPPNLSIHYHLIFNSMFNTILKLYLLPCSPKNFIITFTHYFHFNMYRSLIWINPCPPFSLNNLFKFKFIITLSRKATLARENKPLALITILVYLWYLLLTSGDSRITAVITAWYLFSLNWLPAKQCMAACDFPRE